ncbi:DNA-binding protein [Paenibacillus xylanexedens]|uniref:DNA-binding protein n=1 Tax=Paenibacillus xylanexedens TaxID=528191 RepID=UPI00119DA781|nr:DNA-binding protein [Paenibacillus xylanexedens]
MSTIEVDPNILQQMIMTAVQEAIEQCNLASSNHPALMDKTQLMNFLRIGATKATELLNREDFPVIREFGHPRVPFHSLMAWIDAHTEWVQTNAKGYWDQRGGVA